MRSSRWLIFELKESLAKEKQYKIEGLDRIAELEEKYSKMIDTNDGNLIKIKGMEDEKLKVDTMKEETKMKAENLEKNLMVLEKKNRDKDDKIVDLEKREAE